jgi:hypothetical protein
MILHVPGSPLPPLFKSHAQISQVLALPPVFPDTYSSFLHLCPYCQRTPAAVPTRVNICVSALNKGGSGDPGAQSAVSCTMQGQAVLDIY